MINDKFTFTKTIEKNTNDYIALAYHIDYKDKYLREDEVIINYKEKPIYLRFAYDFDNKNKITSAVNLPTTMRFVPLPYMPVENQQDRSVIYICGSSGGGKSYLVNMICENYRKQYKENKIFFITANNWKLDRSLNKELYTFISIEDFIESFSEPEDIEAFLLSIEFNNSFFIFDDIGAVEKTNKTGDKIIWTIIDIILENKRKNQISICIISHVPTNYRKTSLLIREVKNYIIFPGNLQVKSDRFLQTYLGLSKNQINQITNADYRDTKWLSIDTSRRVVLTQRKAYMLTLKNEKV